MSLVTRCPACATTFKVVRDQLRISDGWVRCGRCSEVFDATLDLHETADAAPSAPVPDESTVPQPPAAEPTIDTASSQAARPPADEPMRNIDEADFLDDETEEIEPSVAESPAAESFGAESLAGDPSEIEPSEFEESAVESLGAEPSAPERPAAEAPAAGPRAVESPAADAPAHVPSPRSPAPHESLSLAVGVVADEPWPQWPPAALPADAPVVPPYPSLPPFPNIDLSLPAAPPIGREPPPPPSPPPVGEDTGNAQLQKALRRARVKSAKIAKAKARGEERAARESAPVVLAASEPETAAEAARRSARFSDEIAGGALFWQQPRARRSLAVVAVLAAVLLLVQLLHHERDLIAARQPGLRPALAALCNVTGCELSALRQIGDITIDGASFAREKAGDAYRLSFTLRNAATVPLAMPAVELSLLDMQERAVVRRVLMPAEFGAPSVLPARAERAASLPLALAGPEAASLPPIAGYRVLAFYP